MTSRAENVDERQVSRVSPVEIGILSVDGRERGYATMHLFAAHLGYDNVHGYRLASNSRHVSATLRAALASHLGVSILELPEEPLDHFSEETLFAYRPNQLIAIDVAAREEASRAYSHLTPHLRTLAGLAGSEDIAPARQRFRSGGMLTPIDFLADHYTGSHVRNMMYRLAGRVHVEDHDGKQNAYQKMIQGLDAQVQAVLNNRS